jgi:AbiV family abortive infection protein
MVMTNSIKHYNIAILLAEHSEYGNARAHLILSAEEAIKSFILFLDSYDLELRKIKEVKKLFFTHRSRHNTIKNFISCFIALKPLIPKKNDVKNKKLPISKMISIQNLLILGSSIYKGIKNYQWWETAEEMKQRGFYADYKNGILLPSDVTKEEYNISLGHIKKLQNELKEWMDEIKNWNINELEDFKIKIESEDYKDLIKDSIY